MIDDIIPDHLKLGKHLLLGREAIIYKKDCHYPYDIDGRGIYCLFYGGQIEYIGISNNIGRRLVDHLNCPDKYFDGMSFLIFNDDIPMELIHKLEMKLINEIQPIQNQELYAGYN